VSYGTEGNTNPAVGATTVSGNGFTQTWSAHVLAEGCNKNQFNVRNAVSGPFDAACRKSHATDRQFIGANGQRFGDFFSWCAVAMLADLLCPYPWRVPTCRDFVELDLALGGTGNSRNDPTVRDRYIANTTNDGQSWFGGGYGGWLDNFGGLNANQAIGAQYWSQTEGATTALAHYMHYNRDGETRPQPASVKSSGRALRCIWGGDPSLIVGVPATLSACAPSTVEIPITRGTGATIYRSNANSSDINIVVTGNSFNATVSGTYLFRARVGEEWGPISQTVVTLEAPHTLVRSGGAALQRLREGDEITPINFTRGGGAAGVSIAWTGILNVTTPPAGVTANTTVNPITISGRTGVHATRGYRTYTYRITTTPALASGVCTPVSDSGAITIWLDVPEARAHNGDPPACNTGTLNLGTVSFVTPTVWTISGNNIVREWSDVVVATGCNKTTFNAGTTTTIPPNINADCRNATNGFHGHYFTWCAVHRFPNLLCPPAQGWRVPTAQDFNDLHHALSGRFISATNQSQQGSLNPADLGYIPTTGSGSATHGPPAHNSRWGGSRWTAHATSLTFGQSYYWSSSPVNNIHALAMNLANASSHPSNTQAMTSGYAVRCVRNVVP
jgi:uncharacterized protein (TIGR02145 family)